MEKYEIAERIKTARELENRTQVWMAMRLGIARQTYLDLENGKTEAKLSIIVKLTKILNRPLEYFTDVTEDDCILVKKDVFRDMQRAARMILSLTRDDKL